MAGQGRVMQVYAMLGKDRLGKARLGKKTPGNDRHD
jgi:hypothetical protein